MAYSKDHKPMMGLHDDIFYTTLEVQVECYPRIKYFQNELQCLFPRFQRIYEKLPGSVKLSDERLAFISSAVHELTNSRPMLFMFGPTHSKIPIDDLVQKVKPNKHETHTFEELHDLGENENFKMVLAMCTLRMMDTKKGQDALRKVKSLFGVENLMLYVDRTYEINRDIVVNNLTLLEDLLNLKHEDIKVVYESEKEIISNGINNHMEHKFINAFASLNTFLLEITKKKSHTRRSTFGDKRTGGRFYREIKTRFSNVLTVIDLLVISKGESTEQKLATAIVAFTKTLLIREIAETYEMQDVQVFDYCQNENYTDIWIAALQKHLYEVPLVKKFDEFIRTQYDESVKSDIEKCYTLNDAKTIGKEVTKVLMGHFLKVGTSVKEIRVNLDLLTSLRKELLRLMEVTIDGSKYVEREPELENWRNQIQGIKEVEGSGYVLGKPVVLVKMSESTEREREIRTHITKSLNGYPSEVIVECASPTYFAGRHGTGTNTKIVMGDAFLSDCGKRGTIGLFMHEDGTEHKDLHFVTSSHVVLGSNAVKTNDQRPVDLGILRHSLLTEDNLVDIAAIKIQEDIQDRCFVFFQDNNETCECTILEMDAIQNLKDGKYVYKRGSTTGETKGRIISEDFIRSGLKDHSFLVGLPVGSDEAAHNFSFAQEGDSGSVLYTKTPDGKVQYVAIVMGKYTLRDEEDNPNSTFKRLTREMGSLILTTCLREGLNRLEQKFNLKLTLPTLQFENTRMKKDVL
ncbi:hypothetical protein CHS0354_011258 [Potamilus streckersoni]|uniref:Uncharacterized protein n=1 Tax=Potamilus streckersoni TaxID=2493646 RepID=A0AAE0RN75_9BIVA|nr:hypothetical protein CHS0354_011258 [Potamilus streckersoni]